MDVVGEVKTEIMKKYKDWDLLECLPKDWKIDKTVGSPVCGYEFCTNGKSVLNGQKRALVRVIRKNTPYHPVDALDKKLKPLILSWLSNLFGYDNYPHSFKDQWINWGIWDGWFTVSFDLRQEEQVKLLSLIHPRFLGVPQRSTLKIVNEKTFYLELKQLLNIEYPDITGSKLLSKIKQRGGTGGWHSASDDFYIYEWEVFLSDGSSLFYKNQKDVMDMVKGDFIYNARIQKRAFVNFLQDFV